MSANAFRFHEYSNKQLLIGLGDNNLNASSFELGAFLYAKRPLRLDLKIISSTFWMNEYLHLFFMLAKEIAFSWPIISLIMIAICFGCLKLKIKLKTD